MIFHITFHDIIMEPANASKLNDYIARLSTNEAVDEIRAAA